eukprot:GCRY01008301.1.p2 GENE.GCRY01008301.1~~GCRY01008301.1.p2  ORF type:complete len:124 (-),score=10.52 GCRY01008301.1:332-703(-)
MLGGEGGEGGGVSAERGVKRGVVRRKWCGSGSVRRRGGRGKVETVSGCGRFPVGLGVGLGCVILTTRAQMLRSCGVEERVLKGRLEGLGENRERGRSFSPSLPLSSMRDILILVLSSFFHCIL